MIIINLSGGLGNQMFQYAFGKAIAHKYGFKLKLDANYYFSEECRKSDLPRTYLLDKYNINAELASISEVNRINTLFVKILRKIKYKMIGPPNPFEYKFGIVYRKDNSYHVGFWQNERYFLSIKDTIIKEFSIKDKMVGVSKKFFNEITTCNNSVSIHVRRTDILKPSNKYGGVCDLDYYNRAIKIVWEKENNPIFFIFSDDIEWCKDNLKIDGQCHFVSNNQTRDYEELILMSKCKHNIIANSSFSWWGAWLNQNRDKIVIAPKIWLNIPEKEYADVLPSSWIKI